MNPILLEELASYNIIQFGEFFYAFPKGSKTPNLENLGEEGINKLKGVFSAPSLDKIKKNILSDPNQARRHGLPVQIEVFGFYNIVAWGVDYYGIPKGLGPLDITKVEVEKEKGVYANRSLEQLKEEIKSNINEMKENFRPIRLENFGFYNIVAWGLDYFGLPKLHGPVDLRKDDLSKIEGAFADNSLANLKKRIENYCRELHRREKKRTEVG